MKNAYKEHRKAEQSGRSEIDEQLMKWAKDEEIVLPDGVKTPGQFAELLSCSFLSSALLRC